MKSELNVYFHTCGHHHALKLIKYVGPRGFEQKL